MLDTVHHDPLDIARTALARAELRIAEAEARALQAEANATDLKAQLDQAEQDKQALRSAYDRLKIELDLLKRKLFVAKAERVDTQQLELEFQQKLAELDAIAGTLGMPAQPDEPPARKRGHNKGGRRDLRQLGLVEQRIELLDAAMEALVEQGKAQRIGFEESARLTWPRRSPGLIIIARPKYRFVDDDGQTALQTAPKPPELLERTIAAPSLLAHIAVTRHCDGMPLHRIERSFEREGFTLDRGTMGRWMEDLGGALGATVVHAMRMDARDNSFCVATDATGFRLHPGAREPGQPRRPCTKGHYFVQIADRTHILLTYVPRETSQAVQDLFSGYAGYVQADAKSVFDVLFRTDSCKEVGCWAHARRKYWDAAFAGSAVGREALVRMGRIFDLDASWKDLPLHRRKEQRQQHLLPHVEALLDWAEVEYARVAGVRGTLRDALGYTVRQKDALRTFLQDARLEMTNNGSERELRQVVVGRKAWLFFGSEEHAESAGELMSLIASARLHKLNPQQYLTELIRVLPHWPTGRYLELSPARWEATRERLSPAELALEIGPLTVPPPMEQQRGTD